ncbi:hypothetical protein [Paenibacillus sp. GCM10012303]|uniref:hypothetical protein n=1 Tax=Paenibacillus sp. GCM10012303 TaxID=3317340 RepID=UPI003608C5B4
MEQTKKRLCYKYWCSRVPKTVAGGRGMIESALSRRKLLMAMGSAGVALAAGGVTGSGEPRNVRDTVLGAVYGGVNPALGCNCPEYVDPFQFGAVGDGVADDTAAIQLAADEARAREGILYLAAKGSFKITMPVNLRYIRHIVSLGTIVSYVDHEPAVVAGDDSRHARPLYLHFASIVKGTARHEDDIGLRLVGIKNGKITVTNCYSLQLFADARDPSMSSIAYSEFYLGRFIRTLELYGEYGMSWINENTFYGGSITKLIIGASYSHNNNIFIKPSVEGAASTLAINNGVRNKFYDLRTEGGTTVTLGPKTYYNVLIDNFISNSGNLRGGANVVDQGFENMHLNSIEEHYRTADVLTLDPNSVVFDGCAEQAGWTAIERPGFDKMVAKNNSLLFETGMVSVEDIRRFRMLSDTKLFRIRVYSYDENKQILNDRLYISGIGGWKQLGDYAGFQTNISEAWIAFTDSAVKYANIAVYHVGPGSFQMLRLVAYLKPSVSDWLPASIIRSRERPLIQSSVPARGFAQPGKTIAKADGSGLWMCVWRKDTRIASPAANNSGSVQVTEADEVLPGDVAAVLLDDRTTHWTKVDSVTGTTIGLTVPLPEGASANRAVAFLRWV